MKGKLWTYTNQKKKQKKKREITGKLCTHKQEMDELHSELWGILFF